jgi:hypothetical protein
MNIVSILESCLVHWQIVYEDGRPWSPMPCTSLEEAQTIIALMEPISENRLQTVPVFL